MFERAVAVTGLSRVANALEQWPVDGIVLGITACQLLMIEYLGDLKAGRASSIDLRPWFGGSALPEELERYFLAAFVRLMTAQNDYSDGLDGLCYNTITMFDPTNVVLRYPYHVAVYETDELAGYSTRLDIGPRETLVQRTLIRSRHTI